MDDSLLAPVIEAIRAGHLDEAEDACRKVAVENSESPDPVHFLGVIASQRGQFSEAIAFYHQAIRLNPSQPSFYTNLGSALYSSGSFNEAIEAFQKAIALQPENPIAHNNLANLLREEGRLAEAESSYLEALRLMPDYPDALNNIGIVLGELGRPDEAIAHYERALAISPNSAEIYNLLGNVLLAGGRPGEAEAGFRRAIELNPDYADAHEGRATAIAAQGRPEEAEFSYLEAIRLNPENTTANLNLAGMYLKYGDSDRALSVYERLILLQPEVVGAHLGKSRALSALCRDGEAVDSIRHAAGLDPENEMLVLASEVYCPALMEGTDEIERRREEIDEALGRRTPGSILLNPDEILRWGTEPSFYLAYHGKNDLAIRSKYADLFRVDDLAEPKGSGEEIYRIGFVVTERHEGIFLSFMEGILKNMFDDRLEVNVICVEGSRKIISEKMGGSKMRYHVISQKFESALREIRAGRYDLLFYFEVGTDSFNYFLPFFRLAPVQCTSWGYPVTSGISQIDYFISSHLVESEDAEEHYRERLECLNALPAYYYRPKAPARPGSRTDFAISESENVYLCSQSLFKIHPDYDKVLANILRSDPVGQVVMIEGKHPNWHRCMQARFRENIPDVAGRVRFVPQM
ncbi:MAG: tetratricopeptide repeat protein, partial [Nitrospinaceae bacterium]|nr:tetratricopeptide repeat protein [Nitrospinaceae bacterium]